MPNWVNSTGDFSARFVDEDVAVRLMVADGSCGLEFGTGTSVFFAKVGHVRCGFDAHRSLVRIDVKSLNHEQVDALQRLLH